MKNWLARGAITPLLLNLLKTLVADAVVCEPVSNLLAAKMGKILGKTRIKVAADDTDAGSLCGTGVSADPEGEK